MELNIAKEIGKTSAILHSDGLALYNKLEAASGSSITLSFKDIVHCTTAFLNASIGKYITIYKDQEKNLHFIDVTDDIKNKINLVLENARDEKKRSSLDESSRQILHA